MALPLSLFHRPGSILFLDDDPDYLDMLGMVMPAEWPVELYARPSGFGARMQHESTRWEADASEQLQIIDLWRQGQPLIPQVLRYWSKNPSRYNLAKVCVIDFAMPGTNGLQVLDTLLDWPGYRVLLTGQADDQIAVQAFNNGLIDQFVPKQAPNITRLLLGVLRKLAATPHARVNSAWLGVLQTFQQSILRTPAVAQALKAYAEQHWVEYVVLGSPFGLLGLDASGRGQWLQLELAANLGDLAELATTAGLGFDTARAVQEGRLLAAVELHQQLNLRGPARTAPSIRLVEDGTLLGALFTLAPEDLPLPILGYRHFLDHLGSRRICDD